MPPNERDTPLSTPEGQRLLGARDVIADEAFRVVTDPCEIPDLHCGVIDGNVGFAATHPSATLTIGALPLPGAGSFTICAMNAEPIFTIHFDGRIEVNPAFTVEEAARAFWEAVERMNPRGGPR